MYAAIFGAAVWHACRPGKGSWLVITALSLLAGTAAIWFIGLQVLAVKRLCAYCLVTHICGILIALIVSRGLLRLRQSSHFELNLCFPVALSMVGLFVTIAGQQIASPDGIEVRTFADNAGVSDLSSSNGSRQSGSSESRKAIGDVVVPAELPPSEVKGLQVTTKESPATDSLPTMLPTAAATGKLPSDEAPISQPPTDKSRKLILFQGQLELDLFGHPFVGNSEAEHVFIKIFDYTCPDCHRVHQQLERYIQECKLSVAIVLMPVPMNRRCNPHVKKTGSRQTEACEYAKLALGVYQADATKYEQFHKWMMRGEFAPSLADSVKYAQNLVGRERFRAAVKEASVIRRRDDYIQLFKSCGATVIPILIVNDKLIIGSAHDYAKLANALDKILAKEPANRGE
jgi:predicted DsbA family dithiol-disulfide isomerase